MINVKNIEFGEFDKFYTESKFWRKVKKISKMLGKSIVYKILALYYILKEPKISCMEKVMIISALGYLISPVDTIPDIIIGLGYTDDIAVLIFVFSIIEKHIDNKMDKKIKKILNVLF